MFRHKRLRIYKSLWQQSVRYTDCCVYWRTCIIVYRFGIPMWWWQLRTAWSTDLLWLTKTYALAVECTPIFRCSVFISFAHFMMSVRVVPATLGILWLFSNHCIVGKPRCTRVSGLDFIICFNEIHNTCPCCQVFTEYCKYKLTLVPLMYTQL